VLIQYGVDSIQSGHLLERLFEQGLRYTLGPTVRQERTLTDSRTSPRRGGESEASFQQARPELDPVVIGRTRFRADNSTGQEL
jgi:hypothetical protein